MNENLEQRKRELVQHLNETLAEKPRRWWQKKEDYVPTKDVGGTKNSHPILQETTIRYDFKGALYGSAFFLAFNFVATYLQLSNKNSPPGEFWFNNVIIIIVLLCISAKSLNRKPRLIFNENGLWLITLDEIIPWHHLVASYIKSDESGESTTHYLVLFYYNTTYNDFFTVEYCIDGLDINYEEIAFQIECWKSFCKK